MSAKELAITILGLAGAFCMPWPGEPERRPAGEPAGGYAVACRAPCGEKQRAGAMPARQAQNASTSSSVVHAVRLPAAR